MYSWQRAKVVQVDEGAFNMKSIFVRPEVVSMHQAGQHYELCLPDKNIIRKYSIVSPVGEKDGIEFGVELIEGGQLSPQLWNLKEGDEVEIRGPLGQAFVLPAEHSGPLLLIGAGSGITPLLSMYYSYKKSNPYGKVVFIMSAKDASRVLHYRALRNLLVTRFTNEDPRIDRAFLKEKIGDLADDPDTLCYICGSGDFTDDMMTIVRDLGVDKSRVFADRFI